MEKDDNLKYFKFYVQLHINSNSRYFQILLSNVIWCLPFITLLQQCYNGIPTCHVGQ